MNKKYIFILVILLSTIILLSNISSKKNEDEIIISQEEWKEGLKDFKEVDGEIVSTSNDPWILIDLVEETEIKNVHINVANISKNETLAQIFYKTDGNKFSQENSVKSHITVGENIIALPNKVKATSLRLDVTNEKNVKLDIQEISLNKEITYMYYLKKLLGNKGFLLFFIIAITLISFKVFYKPILKVCDIIFHPLVAFYNNFIEFIKNNIYLVLFGIAFIFIFFGYDIFNFSLTLDEEVIINKNGNNTHLFKLSGRYGTYILRELFQLNDVFVVGLSSILSYCMLLISGLIFCYIINYIYNCTTKYIYVFFIGIFMSVPYIVTEYMSFSFFSTQMMFGMILVFLSLIYILYFNDNSKKIYLIYSTIFLTFTIMIYQAFLPVYITSVCIIMYLHTLNNQKSFREIFKLLMIYIAVFITGFIINTLIQKGILMYFGGNKDYINKIRGDDSFNLNSAFKGFTYAMKYIAYNREKHNFFFIATTWILMVIVFITNLFEIRKSNKVNKLLENFFLVSIIISPFLINFVLMRSLPPRVFLQAQLAYAFLWFVILNKFKENKLQKIFVIGIASLLILNQAQIVNKINYSSIVRYELDKSMAHRLMDDIYSLDEYSDNKQIIFIGKYKHNENNLIEPSTLQGKSYFHYQTRAPHNIVNFFETLGYQIKVAGDEKRKELEATYKGQLNVWPRQNSILVTDQYIIVKLAE